MSKQWTTTLLIAAAIVALTTAFLRLLYILPSTHRTKPPRRNRGTPTRLLVVLGSGGHTAEMLRLLHDLDPASYTYRSYVVSEGDEFSAGKAREFERQLAARHSGDQQEEEEQALGKGNDDEVRWAYEIRSVPRARRIHQSLVTTPWSAVRCLLACFGVLRSPSHSLRGMRSRSVSWVWYPDLILTNGPGTAVCVVLAALILRFFSVRGTDGTMRTIYVESWARVRRLSLSGRILSGVVERFVVQWEGLKGAGGRAEYIGVLVS